MTDDAMELTGRLVNGSRQNPPRATRTLDVPSRVVQRRDAILTILDAAYRRDLRGTPGM